MAKNGENRIRWIDIAKAMVMVLVVFGHTMRGGAGQRMVYSFHVVAFYFLAGMTAKTDHAGKRILADLRRILVPYFAFGLISIAVYALLGRFAAGKLGMDVDTSIWNNLRDLLYANARGRSLQFNTPLWFLPCLFAVKLVYYGVDRLCKGKQGPILLASLVLAAISFGYLALELPYPPFSLTVALKMLPFFALGRICFLGLPELDMERFRRPGKLLAGCALLGVACVVGYFAPKVNYSGDTFPNVPAFCVTALCGSVGVCLLAMGIEKCRILEYVGKETLAILVMHKFPVLLFQTVGPFKSLLAKKDTLAGNLLGGFPVALVAIGLCLVASVVVKWICPQLLGVEHMKKRSA